MRLWVRDFSWLQSVYRGSAAAGASCHEVRHGSQHEEAGRLRSLSGVEALIVYVPLGNGPLRRAIIAAGHGMIVCRPHFGLPKLECPWVFDNGAFVDFLNGSDFDGDGFERCVIRLMDIQPCQRPEWSVVPDIVASPKSLPFSVHWRETLPDDLKWYLAIQDGMTPELVDSAFTKVPFDGLFIGGSSAWKNSMACEWVKYGHGRKLPVHIGRVNGWKRLQWAVNIGADSVDGTGWTRDPRWLAFLQDLPKKERMLWDAEPHAGSYRSLESRPASGA